MKNVSLREIWLSGAVEEFQRELFTGDDMAIPQNLRVACGWPGRGGTSRIGECWPAAASADGHIEIMVSPALAAPMEVLGCLAHEVIHAIRPTAKHGPQFRTVAQFIGLAGKMTATTVGPELAPKLERVAAKLGAYPHGELTRGGKIHKQTTRMLKMQCEACGFIARTTQKWIDEVGPPSCACNGRPMMIADSGEKDGE